MVDKLERLGSLIAELSRAERALTARQLRERVLGYDQGDDESFKRAFERDKAELRDTGVPLTVERVLVDGEAVDGYRIDPDDLGDPDLDLDADEHAALVLATRAVRLQGHNAATGLEKLGGAGTADLTPADMALLPSDEHLSDLLQACTERRSVRFVHRSKDRHLDPLRLHHERGHWYVQAFDRGAEAVRLYRTDRIEGSVTLDDEGTADRSVDPADHPIELAAWALGDGEVTTAVVHVAPSAAGVAARAVGDDAAEWHDDGSVSLTMQVRRWQGLRDFVLSFLGDAEVVEPDAWRDDLHDWLQAIAAGGR